MSEIDDTGEDAPEHNDDAEREAEMRATMEAAETQLDADVLAQAREAGKQATDAGTTYEGKQDPAELGTLDPDSASAQEYTDAEPEKKASNEQVEMAHSEAGSESATQLEQQANTVDTAGEAAQPSEQDDDSTQNETAEEEEEEASEGDPPVNGDAGNQEQATNAAADADDEADSPASGDADDKIAAQKDVQTRKEADDELEALRKERVAEELKRDRTPGRS
jgi:hypothetical protein